MIERCKDCGANLAMVGLRHRCVPGAAQALADAKAREQKESKHESEADRKKVPVGTRHPDRRNDRLLVSRTSAVEPKPEVGTSVDVSGGSGQVAEHRTGPLKRGRPKVEGPRPWEAEGVSRRTWYRRKAEEKK